MAHLWKVYAVHQHKILEVACSPSFDLKCMNLLNIGFESDHWQNFLASEKEQKKQMVCKHLFYFEIN